MSKRLNDKVALITGAAELALFVKEGAKVIATDINAKLLNKHVDTLKEQYGDAILPLKLDVTKEDEWIDAVAQGIKKFKKIDILVNNAGIGITDNTSGLTDSTVNDWHLFMDTNAMSHFLGMKHVVPEMKKIGGGSIINIPFLASVQGTAGAPPYTASKGASWAFTKGAARDLGKYNIRVNSVLPGWIVTPLMQAFTLNKQLLDPLIAGIPLGHLGDPEDVAYPVLFLVSDEAKYVNGAELIVDGGQSVR